jgi:hypothetical protein
MNDSASKISPKDVLLAEYSSISSEGFATFGFIPFQKIMIFIGENVLIRKKKY